MSKKLKVLLLVLIDLMISVVALFTATAIAEYDFIGTLFSDWYYFLALTAIAIACNFVFRLYTGVWKFAGFSVMCKIVASCFFLGIASMVVAIISEQIQYSWAIAFCAVFFILTCFCRFSYRLYYAVESRFFRRRELAKAERVMIIGAGSAGEALIREMKTSKKINMNPVCLLDDNKSKIGQNMDGVRIVGKTLEVVQYAEKYNVDKIIIAMPSADKKVISKIIGECQKTGCKTLVAPGIYQLASEQVSVSMMKEVSIQDLLGREQVKVNLDEIMGYIENKVVLVTGGGGSIGSELCRQIAWHNPKQLIIVDIYENNAYDIQQELIRHCPNLNLLVLIASVRDSKKINDIFETYRPEIVFHAAAHKHVPLMETSPNEAVKNNVSGTYKVAEAAGKYGAEKFILISTDKAVNPTNIMGATKRICEMIIQAMNNRHNTEYVAVRFGNVLGSNGSVIPLFKKQIAEGGPVTVTHKDIVRYFMTIPEAVSLVLQAGAYAKGGEIFVLDMGDPVRIYDLAVNMIRLSGLEPFKDIDIKITGLRPGEKLYEERLMEEEGLQKTENEMISIGKPLDFDEKNLFNKINELYVEAYKESNKMKELVHELVPTYVIDKRKFKN
jgi:FlaA1/EpsC-like NDP-sugar epimerase